MRSVTWRQALIALMAVVGFLLGGAVGSDGLFSEVVAAWLQAIGSLVGIGLAWFLASRETVEARRQLEQERADRRADAVAQLEGDRAAAVAMIHIAAERVRGLGRALRLGGMEARIAVQAGEGALIAADRVVGSYPLHRIRDQHGIIQASHVIGILDLAIQSFRELRIELQQPIVAREAAINAVATNLEKWANEIDGKATVLIQRFGLPVA